MRILEYRGVSDGGCDGGSEREWDGGEQWSGDDPGRERIDLWGEHGVRRGIGRRGVGSRRGSSPSPDGDLAEDKVVTTAGSNSATATLTSSGPWVMQMVTFK